MKRARKTVRVASDSAVLGHFTSTREARRYLATGSEIGLDGLKRTTAEAGYRVEIEDENGEWRPAKQQAVTGADRHTPDDPGEPEDDPHAHAGCSECIRDNYPNG